MKKLNVLMAAVMGLLLPIILLAQEGEPAPVIEVPQTVIGWGAQILIVAGLVYAAINGLKNLVPAIRDNPMILKILNAVGNAIPQLSLCFIVGHITDLFDLLKCIGAVVIGTLVSAGLFQAKKEADIARAAAGVRSYETAKEKV